MLGEMRATIENSLVKTVGRDSKLYNEAIRLAREKLPSRLFWVAKVLLYESKGLMEGRMPGMFSNVGIETTSSCNRKCEYCPLSNKELRDKRGNHHMDPEMFSRIINQLAKENFAGKLALQGYGEPMLDPQFIERVREARAKLPRAYITFNSNGDFLTEEIFLSLAHAGISHIYITQHSKDKKPPIIELRDREDVDSELRERIKKTVSFYPQLVVLQNRGGAVNLDKFAKERVATAKNCERCISSAYTMTINVDGTVSACDNDFLREDVMGRIDPEQNNLLDIWRNQRYVGVRRRMILRALNLLSSGDYSVCNKCNIADHEMSD